MKKVWRYWDLRDDLLKSLQGGSEEFKKDERVQGLLSHPWTTVTQRMRATVFMS